MAFKTRFPLSRFKKDVDEEFVCSLCQGVFEDPVTCCCPDDDHMFCRSCISQSLSSKMSCPSGGTPLTVDTLQSAPRVMKKWIDDLQIQCKFVILGCETMTKFEHIAKHELECSFGRTTKNEIQLGGLLVKAQALAIEDAKREEAVKLMADEILALHTKKTDFENEMKKFEEEMMAKIKDFKNSTSREIKELIHKSEMDVLSPAEGVAELLVLNSKQDDRLTAIGRELRSIRREHFPLNIRNPSRQSDVKSENSSKIVFGEDEVKTFTVVDEILDEEELSFEEMCGVKPPKVSQEHEVLVRDLQGKVTSKRVLEILQNLDFRNYLPGQTTKARAEKLGGQLEHIKDAILPNDYVLLIGGNIYLAVCAAILAGPKGRVFCQNFGVALVKAAGFGHFLDGVHKRIEFVPPQNLIVDGYPDGAPYGLILTKRDWFNETIRRQLMKDGYALDYNTGQQVR